VSERLESIRETDRGSDVLQWTLCRPQRRNAVDPAALRFIARRCVELRGQTVVLAAEGSEAFCSGFDLDALASSNKTDAFPDTPLIEATAAMASADATFIAKIGGYVIGAGVELVCACDLRIARRGIYFVVPAGRLGVVYHPTGVQRLHRVFGPALSRHLLLLGRRVSGAQAECAGALTELVDPDGLDEAVQRAVTNLSRGSSLSRTAHRNLLRQLDAGRPTPPQVRDYEALRERAYASLETKRDDGS
jgi:enoyl-CoA hydratase